MKNNIKHIAFIITVSVFFADVSKVFAGSVSIPLSTIKKPANDLLNEKNQPIDAGTAAALAKNGIDISSFNPSENKLWQNKKYSLKDIHAVDYPKENKIDKIESSGVRFLSSEADLKFTSMSRVQSLENPKLFFRMTLSRYTHATLMRVALLRKLGYYVPMPMFYKQLRIQFASNKERDDFVGYNDEAGNPIPGTAEAAMSTDFQSRKWIVSKDDKTHSVTMASVLLEPATADYFDIQWAVAPDPNNPNQLPAVQRYSFNRAYRALIIPYSLVDIPESINRFSAKWASVLSGHLVINHPFAESFAACTYEDAKWLMKRMAQLTSSDWWEIVQAGQFPKDLESLVYAKLLHRAHNALEFFSLKNSNWILPKIDQIQSTSGFVKNGKVMQELIPGYPVRFAHGERQSPFQDGDYLRYLNIRGKSAVIGTLMNQINKNLDLLSVEDLYAKRRTDLQNRVLNHIRTNPTQPLYQKIEAWGGPVGGFNLSAARHITTGTYYGSQAPIQLVDNISVMGRLGYFMTLAGYTQGVPQFGANTFVQRDYTHVRPVLSIQEGKEISWKNLLIPRFMNKISSVLNSTEKLPGRNSQDPARDPLDAFLLDLRDGEVFTITDSITVSAYAQLSSTFDVLMGLQPLNFLNTVSLGGDASKVILRQTSFTRTGQGIQVSVRQQKGALFGVNLDVNYFINLLRTRAQVNVSQLKSDVFVIDYQPELAAQLDETNQDQDFVKKFLKTKQKLQPVLRALFQDNEPELLYTHFKYNQFSIDHHLKTKEFRNKFLAQRVASFTEDHLLKLRYPRSEEAPELDPKDEEVILFSNKKGKLQGYDLLGFVTDWIEGLFNEYAPKARLDLATNEDPNPANIPFGKAYWKIITTETDLSPQLKQQPTVSILQHVWGGWKLKKADFYQLIDEIQQQFQNTKVASYRLIEKEAFANVESVDFYRINAQLSVLPEGVLRLRDLILQPDLQNQAVKKSNWLLGRVFQGLSGALGHSAKASDQGLFKDILYMLGNGSLAAGQKKYASICQSENQKINRRMDYTGQWWNGSYYECLLPWTKRLIDLSRKFPKEKKDQARWASEVLFVLDENIPLPQIMNYLGEKNYVFFVRINGFRTGDEDGDIEYFSNTIGDPGSDLDYSNGLMARLSAQTRILPVELDRSQASFR